MATTQRPRAFWKRSGWNGGCLRRGAVCPNLSEINTARVSPVRGCAPKRLDGPGGLQRREGQRMVSTFQDHAAKARARRVGREGQQPYGRKQHRNPRDFHALTHTSLSDRRFDVRSVPRVTIRVTTRWDPKGSSGVIGNHLHNQVRHFRAP